MVKIDFKKVKKPNRTGASVLLKDASDEDYIVCVVPCVYKDGRGATGNFELVVKPPKSKGKSGHTEIKEASRTELLEENLSAYDDVWKGMHCRIHTY